MKLRAKLLVGANLALVLLVGIWLVWQKEETMKNGELILLQLAPKDPLSLMQGYYMDLRYRETQDLTYDSIPSRGYIIFETDSNNVGNYVSTVSQPVEVPDNQLLIRYFFNDRFVSIGAESYFFEEGQASCYENAMYGGLHVDSKGNSVLSGLYDKNRQLIQPSSSCEGL